MRELSKELQARACKELNEDPKRRAADIAHIREWLKKQPHIRGDPDDWTILCFLRGCKFSLERTKEKFDMYYTIRTLSPEFFRDADMSNKALIEIMKLGLYILLPGVDDQGRKVFIIRPGVTDTSKHKIEDQFKLSFMMAELLLREDDDYLVTGIVTLIDLANVTLAHGALMTPSVVKKLMVCSQDGYPIRQKAVNYVNLPPLFDTVFSLFKAFAKEKMKNRFFVHGNNLESLYKNIPKRLMPAEYGGEAGTINELVDGMQKRMEAYQSFYLEMAGAGVDENKRPGKPKTHQELFGVEGSFRQLSVD